MEKLEILLDRGNKVQVTRDGVVVCEGRSFGDVLKALSDFFGVSVITDDGLRDHEREFPNGPDG